MFVKMITKEQIVGFITEKVVSEGYFLVDLAIKPPNRIVVLIDGDNGVPIDFCVAVSRLIEQNLDRETEDFELEVSSPGIGQPFRVYRQYLNNIGRDVEVLTVGGLKTKGELAAVSESGFVVKESIKVKPEGKKKKELQIIERSFLFKEIKSVKEIIKF
jgi:ribosome maturation factor RimP